MLDECMAKAHGSVWHLGSEADIPRVNPRGRRLDDGASVVAFEVSPARQ